MYARLFQKSFQSSAKRSFSSSIKAAAHHPYKEGVYSNLPFKVHNRKIPYAVPHFLFFFLGFGVPVLAVFVQQKRAGIF